MGRISISTAVASANYPATGNNRTIKQMSEEIASYTGGEAKDVQKDRAVKAIQRAMRSLDVWAWRFNILTQDITIPGSPASGNNEYNLSANFHSPIRAHLVDSNGYTREDLTFVKWPEWVTFLPDQSTTAGIPQYYTIRNEHEVGRVTLDPPPASSVTWPTVRIYYHRRIVWPTATSSKLSVPIDFEELIFEMAVAQFMAQHRSAREAAAHEATYVRPLRLEIMNRWRSYEDVPALGA